MALAAAPIGPLAWEPPYAAGAAQEIAKKTKNKKTKTKNRWLGSQDLEMPLFYSALYWHQFLILLHQKRPPKIPFLQILFLDDEFIFFRG